MKALYLLCRLRVLELLRTKASLLLFIGLPLILLLAIGSIFADGHPFERRQVAVVAAPAETKAVLAALTPYPELHLLAMPEGPAALGLLRGHMLDAVLLVPSVKGQEPARLYTRERGRLFGRALLSALPPALAPVLLETAPDSRFGYVHYLFSGLLAFSILVAGLLGMGSAMARYRQNQLLKKLALTPLRRSTFVAAQLLSRSGLGLLQIAALIAFARLLFGLPLSAAAVVWLLLVSLLGLLTFMGIGFLLAALLRSEGLLLEGVSALMTPLVLLSGMFFPLSELPRPLSLFGEALPSTQLVELLRAALLFAGGHPALNSPAWLPSLLSLCAWLLLSFCSAVVMFKWHD